MSPAVTVAVDDDGRPWIEVYLGQRYRVSESGACAPELGEYAMVTAIELYPGIVHPGFYQPGLLRRDRDLQPRRRATDVVVQGTWRSDHAVREAVCALECRGAASFRRAIHIFGDRRVERGRTGPRLSAPEPLVEAPIRYDRAYGGTDEGAARRSPDPLEEALRGLVSDEVFRASSTYSYPRNHAGRGYLVDAAGLGGLALPNLEWQGEELAVDDLVAPLDAWDTRPLPAAFDWYNHAWFPRLAFFDDYPKTAGDRPPARELALGIIDPEIGRRPAVERPCDAFFQGAHPLLWTHRLRGDEELVASGMSVDGRDTRVRLPGLRPEVQAVVEGRALGSAPAALDLVFIETELAALTLIWRARLAADDPSLAHRPRLRAEVDVRWRR